MIVFDKQNFNEINYLNFDKDFKIDINKDKIKVILSPNGIGKTSIYHNIQERYNDFAYIDYDSVKNSVTSREGEIIIASSIKDIELKNKEIERNIINANIEESFKSSNLKQKTDFQKISDNLWKNKKEFDFLIENFNGDNLDALFNLNDGEKQLLLNYGKKIINQSLEETSVDDLKNTIKKKYLELIDQTITDDDFVCPICSKISDESIKTLIKEKLKLINESTNEIVKDYITKNSNVKPEDIIIGINNLKKIIKMNNITNNNLENYVICGCNKEKAKLIVDLKNDNKKLKSEIAALETKKADFYNNIKRIKDRIVETFENQLDVKNGNVSFDDSKKELMIKLDRPVNTYSTGEINLITFIVSLLEFMNSDKDTVIIDDPLSSYDIPNQYKIMYEITDSNSNKKYNMLIFTHNIDCVNIANSQNSGAYEFELMDRINEIQYLNQISSLDDKGFNICYILTNLEKKYQYREYIELLSKKDEWNPSSNEHKLFHYDGKYNYPNNNCNNDELVKLIEDIDNTTYKNYNTIINSANKIMYLCALRVWIEKQFYDNNDDATGLKKNTYFGNKVIFMFDKNHWTGSTRVTKSYLMSKKVMLNQNDHAYSQKEPFYYALSISTDNIINEIIDIKNHFIDK